LQAAALASAIVAATAAVLAAVLLRDVRAGAQDEVAGDTQVSGAALELE